MGVCEESVGQNIDLDAQFKLYCQYMGSAYTMGSHQCKRKITESTNEICKERNQRIFEKRNQPWEAIAREITYISSVGAPPRVSLLVQIFRFYESVFLVFDLR